MSRITRSVAVSCRLQRYLCSVKGCIFGLYLVHEFRLSPQQDHLHCFIRRIRALCESSHAGNPQGTTSLVPSQLSNTFSTVPPRSGYVFILGYFVHTRSPDAGKGPGAVMVRLSDSTITTNNDVPRVLLQCTRSNLG